MKAFAEDCHVRNETGFMRRFKTIVDRKLILESLYVEVREEIIVG